MPKDKVSRLTLSQVLPIVLLSIGLAMCVLALTANWLGLRKHPGIGERQIQLFLVGIGCVALSRLPLSSSHGGIHISWPTRQDTSIALVAGILITAIDLGLSSQFGLLAYPPYYDGIGYMLSAKSVYYHLSQLPAHFQPFTSAHLQNILSSPAWQTLLLTSFLVFGEGEWQAYTVRFWPVFLLLLLIFWVVRRRAGSRTAWVALLFTCAIPTVSVGLQSTIDEFFTEKIGIEWYLADLRPDLMFTVLLLWTVVPLIDYAESCDQRLFLLSGVTASLAILTKSSAMPVLLFSWGFAMAFVVVLNRLSWRMAVVSLAWAIIPFAILLAPWVAAGGFIMTVSYLYMNLAGPAHVLWANANATLLSEATYYWRLFPVHLGHVTGWGITGCALVSVGVAARKTGEWPHKRLLAYLILSATLYVIASATTSKNFFVGLPYYLLLWTFSWTSLGPLLKEWMDRNRLVSWAAILVPALYVTFLLGGATYAARHWPGDQLKGGIDDRSVAQQIAGDLGARLSNEDLFISMSPYGFPATLQYYMVGKDGTYPLNIFVNTWEPFDSILSDTVKRSKAIIVFGDVQQANRYSTAPKASLPAWEGITEWVRRPESSYQLMKEYQFSGRSPLHRQLRGETGSGFTMQVWIKPNAPIVRK